jgi:hypothetical protein
VQLDHDAQFLSPARQAGLTAAELGRVCQSDDGMNPLPAFDLHLQAARVYGDDMQSLQWTPAASSPPPPQLEQPRAALLDLLTHVGGYKQDPLRKKAMLLALVLEQDPKAGASGAWRGRGRR